MPGASTVSETVAAATLVEPGRVEVRRYPYPSAAVEAGGAVLRVEVCGLCGTDVEQFHGRFTGSTWPDGPLVPGHEVVGVIEEIGADAAGRWGVQVGDRVAIEPNIPCGTCPLCLRGSYVACQGWSPAPMAYGFVPVSHPPSLWGGWAELMALHPGTVLHRVPDGLDTGTASLFNALGAGFRWAVTLPHLAFGQTIVVLGAGQRGLACVAAARAAGAGTIVVSGRAPDAHKLEAARALGADVTVDVDAADLVAVVRDVTGGELADVAVDASAGATAPVLDALRCVRPEGTVVLAGLKGGRPVDGFPVDDVVLRGIRVLGARSTDWDGYEQALTHLSRHPDRFVPLRTHVLPIARADHALRILSGDLPAERPIYVAVSPLA
jgi:threonine dehydrogenase-like Zn-dependent dehydrogenase